MTVKKRNPQDTTLRNLRAVKKTIASIQGTVAHLTRALALLRLRVENLDAPDTTPMGSNDLGGAAVVVDCETFAIDGVAAYLDAPTPPENYKNPDTIAAWIAAAKIKQVQKAALRPDLARLVALCWQMEDRDSQPRVWTCKDTHEERLAIRDFVKDITLTGGGVRRVVTFNGHRFDLPMIMRRALALREPYPHLRIDRASPHSDLLRLLTFDGAIDGHSLKFYVKRYELDGGIDDDVDGADIDALVQMGKWDAVAAHCVADVSRTWALASWMGVIEHREPAEIGF